MSQSFAQTLRAECLILLLAKWCHLGNSHDPDLLTRCVASVAELVATPKVVEQLANLQNSHDSSTLAASFCELANEALSQLKHLPFFQDGSFNPPELDIVFLYQPSPPRITISLDKTDEPLASFTTISVSPAVDSTIALPMEDSEIETVSKALATRNHVLMFSLIGSILVVRYHDHLRTIESSGIDIAENPSLLFALLSILQRFHWKDWGLTMVPPSAHALKINNTAYDLRPHLLNFIRPETRRTKKFFEYNQGYTKEFDEEYGELGMRAILRTKGTLPSLITTRTWAHTILDLGVFLGIQPAPCKSGERCCRRSALQHQLSFNEVTQLEWNEYTLLQSMRDAVAGHQGLYNQGMLHGDVHPGNIIWDPIAKKGALHDVDSYEIAHKVEITERK